MKIKEVRAKSVLSKSKLYGADYSINPYTGCGHACHYCYAVFMKKYTDHPEPWGSFVDVKINSPELLKKELKKAETGSVLLSSVTDPYQPLEKKYKLTRQLLSILSETEFPVTILTKNFLVLRDLDILKRFTPGKISVGFTVNFSEDEDRKNWEPSASPIEERIRVLEKLHSEKIPTYVHVGPWFEGITDLEKILRKTRDFIYEFQVENLNPIRKETILKTIRNHYPDLEKKYKKILSDPTGHNKRLKKETEKLKQNFDLPIQCFID